MKKRKDEKFLGIEEGKEFVSKTIVGGRPMKPRKVKMNIPAGIEKILYKAAVDPDFKAMLFKNRTDAIEARGFRLTPSESSILQSVPDETISLIIDSIEPEKHGKKRFMKAVAAAVVTLATGTASVSCEDGGPGPQPVGDTADIPHESFPDIIGDTSDIPPEVEEGDIPPEETQDVADDEQDVADDEQDVADDEVEI